MRFYLCVGVLSVGLVLASRAASAQAVPWDWAARVAEQELVRTLDGTAWSDHLRYHQQVGGEPSLSCYWEQQRLQRYEQRRDQAERARQAQVRRQVCRELHMDYPRCAREVYGIGADRQSGSSPQRQERSPALHQAGRRDAPQPQA